MTVTRPATLLLALALSGACGPASSGDASSGASTSAEPDTTSSSTTSTTGTTGDPTTGGPPTADYVLMQMCELPQICAEFLHGDGEAQGHQDGSQGHLDDRAHSRPPPVHRARGREC